jgi:hypothetical protein
MGNATLGQRFELQAAIVQSTILARFRRGSKGCFGACTQYHQALVLDSGLLTDPAEASAALRQLQGALAAATNHFRCGIFGVSMLLRVLTAAGLQDTAWALLQQRDAGQRSDLAVGGVAE